MRNPIFHMNGGSAAGPLVKGPLSAFSQTRRALRRIGSLMEAGCKWVVRQQQSRSHARRLRLEETISLGQKRFLALVQIDGQRLLVGGGATEVTLLANLGAAEPFSALLKETAIAPFAAPPRRTRRRTAKPKTEPGKCA